MTRPAVFLAAYYRTVMTSPGGIPKQFRLSPGQLEEVEGSETEEEQRRLLEQIVVNADLPVAMRTIQVTSSLHSYRPSININGWLVC